MGRRGEERRESGDGSICVVLMRVGGRRRPCVCVLCHLSLSSSSVCGVTRSSRSVPSLPGNAGAGGAACRVRLCVCMRLTIRVGALKAGRRVTAPTNHLMEGTSAEEHHLALHGPPRISQSEAEGSCLELKLSEKNTHF